VALILDETYRDFHASPDAPHNLFTDPDWQDVVIHLYSFSKAYRLTGHRVGAVATSPARLREIEKFLDCVTICPTGLGQCAALWGLDNLRAWLAGERAEILHRRAALATAFDTLKGWELRSSGAYFGYVAHPFAQDAATFARHLVHAAGVLVLPGSMFGPEGDAQGAHHLRIAFANADCAGIAELAQRLAEIRDL
jgi:aspartate/methionine/tyrosine aminotransferase